MNELALFAGAGGGILGGLLLGWRTVCAVEIDAYARDVLVARQNDGCLSPFPIWDDVRTFDGRPWKGSIDVVSGGFPCQDISAAGKGEGITGTKSGLWKEMARIIGEVRPKIAWVENSPCLVRRGIGTVLGDLAEMGFDAEWGVVSAENSGAVHERERIWILAYDPEYGRRAWGSGGFDTGCTWESEQPLQILPYSECPERRAKSAKLRNMRGQNSYCIPQRKEMPGGAGTVCSVVSDDNSTGLQERRGTIPKKQELIATEHLREDVPDDEGTKSDRGRDRTGRREWSQVDAVRLGAEGTVWWESEPDVGRVAHGVAARVDRLRCLGNGQVPAVVRLAHRIISARTRIGT